MSASRSDYEVRGSQIILRRTGKVVGVILANGQWVPLLPPAPEAAK